MRRHRADGGGQRPVSSHRDRRGVRRGKGPLKGEQHRQMFRSDAPTVWRCSGGADLMCPTRWSWCTARVLQALVRVWWRGYFYAFSFFVVAGFTVTVCTRKGQRSEPRHRPLNSGQQEGELTSCRARNCWLILDRGEPQFVQPSRKRKRRASSASYSKNLASL